MLVGSVAASLLVLAVLQYYALQGLEILQTRGAPAIAAAWVPPSEGTAQPERLEAVRAAMQHSWHGYETYAWGADELHPRSKKGKEGVMGGLNGFTGLGASIVDAMSTLHLMGLEEEFERATAWVAANMTINPDKHQYVSFFETTIRLVGGLLSAHDLSGYPVFLDKAHDVARRLLAAFDGTGTGILLNNALLPWTSSDENDEHVPLAELGSNLIELGTLSARTGNETFKEKAEGGLRFLHAKHPEVPLLGTSVSRRTGKIEDSRQSVGAPVDSYLEYLLKYWILTGKKVRTAHGNLVNTKDTHSTAL